MTAYYNEYDLVAAQWLENLIQAGHIAPGVVDRRSIIDVRPSDLKGFTQCHFFAGVGVWSYALRAAAWPDNRPVWTGSCPCQPFSAAGKGLAFADERHLWPAFHHLIAQCQPAVVLGEQVASKDVDAWIDLVHADLEAMGYAFGSVPFPSAGVGAPHIRDRNYWAAVSGNRRGMVPGRTVQGGLANDDKHGRAAHSRTELHDAEHYPEPCGGPSGMGVATGIGRQRIRAEPEHGEPRQAGKGEPGRLVHAKSVGRRLRNTTNIGPSDAHGDLPANASGLPVDGSQGERVTPVPAGPTNGFWRDVDWLGCRDGKWRPVMPGTFPLVNGAAARVGRLRAYGNAVNAEAARVWIECVMECQP